MVEQVMIFGFGFLIAACFCLLFTPLVHNRAVRLTMRRLGEAMPANMAEISAQRDQQRAEFAVAVRRLEVMADDLRAKTMTHVAELDKRSKTINRLREEIAQRDATTSTQVAELGKQSKTIDQLRDEIAQRDATTSTQVAELGKRSRTIDQLRDEIAQRDATTSTQVAELGKRSKTIDQLRTEIAQRDAATSLLEARIKSLLGQVRLTERRLVLDLLPQSSRHPTPAE